MPKKILAIFCLVLSSVTFASSLPAFPFIHATGEALLVVRPDVGEIDFELTELTSDPQQTMDIMEKNSAEVIAFLVEQGLLEEDIEAAEVKKYISPVEYLDSSEAQKKFRLMRNFHLVIRDIQKWNAIVSGLLAKPYLGNFSVSFGRSDMERIQNDLVLMATSNAKQNAARLAQGLSVRLGPANAASQSPLKSVSTILGMDGVVKREEQIVQNKPISRDLAVPTLLKFKQSVDVVFRIKF
ncbi:SIMPL domain-containing protein [Undibacterium sp. Di24W]|uniref:SIMPL domain-containing protein n=1 Tax=Undibacterium sp. Di24W TaxID=3413033 RepID=UPI003BF3B81D